ncbi:UvrD-helicase domain-containing protein [Vibrio sp. D431a]|uniref:UvrD-helicase domain-containing protein n=1 Tax=Vibrio sp. D431a TaxID=2837388 RepID=UPI002552E9D8|nr:UvrD-helicase domain-containing protein [Vibrio sp. D431a]MDK9790155.1 UvrD-helicase domain-containing protein [Vibrio sp. D431a]
MIEQRLQEIETKAINEIKRVIRNMTLELESLINTPNKSSLTLEDSMQSTNKEEPFKQAITPTIDQQRAINLSKSGKDLIVEAYSGSGKTTLLEAISRESLDGKRVLYLSFNKAIAKEAQSKFPRHVSCLTTHSLAYRELIKNDQLRQDRIAGGLYPFQLVQLEDIKEGVGQLTNLGLAAYVIDILKNYCQSDCIKISKKHRKSPLISSLSDKSKVETFNAAVEIAKSVWKKVNDPECDFPITHDFYLKMWTLTKPTLDYDTILVDEAQDSNSAIIGVLNRQKAQLIWVGDKFQSIYSWRGAVNALSQVSSSHSATIPESFRYGTQLANLASSILSIGYKTPIKISGNTNVDTKIEHIETPRAIISRTNSALITSLIAHNRSYPKHHIYVEGGVKPLLKLVNGISNLQEGKRTLVPELAVFESWSEAVEHSKTPEGRSLKGIVNLGNQFDCSKTLELLKSRVITESAFNADIVFTTAHKAKGKEYETVALNNDFSLIGEKTHHEEVNLLYVAVTRAIYGLDITQCQAAQIECLAA